MRLSSITTVLAASGIIPAMAAPDCNTDGFYKVGSLSLYMPFRGSSINCELGQGNNSDAVKALQTQINLCYASVIAAKLVVDGDFGGKTKAAVKAVQKAINADDDGRYGPETRGKMNFGLYFNSNPNDIVCKRLADW